MNDFIDGKLEHINKATTVKPNLGGVLCFNDKNINQKIQFQSKEHIGVDAAHMLLWKNKCGNINVLIKKL